MAFNFGAPAPDNAGGEGGSGFNSSSSAPAPTSTPVPSFTFGSTSSNTPAPTVTPTTAVFGGSSTPAPPNAPAPGGSSFGGSSTPAPSNVPGPGQGGSSFGASSSLAPSSGNPTPAPGGFGAPNLPPGRFSSSTSSTTSDPSISGPKGLVVPEFQSVFPHDKIYSQIKALLSKSALPTEEGREAASELMERLRCDGGDRASVGQILTSPKALQYTPPDNNLRNQLQSNPVVVLPGNREAALLPEMLREVLNIADELRISEKEALVLYAEASKDATRSTLEEKLEESIIDRAKSHNGFPRAATIYFGTDVVQAAKELYFFERQRPLRTLLVLVQSRIEAGRHRWGDMIIEATDSLLQNGLITKLIDLIREWTSIVGNIEQELAKTESLQVNKFSAALKKKTFHFDQVHLTFALQERHTAAECLFYVAYHTQYEAQEIAKLIDLVRDLTNGDNKGLPVLNPFQDVPSSYEDRSQTDQAWAQFQSSLPPLKEKEHLEWEQKLVQKVCSTTKPQLLHCVGTLVMTVISALDAKQIYFDRNSHQENDFGKGNMLFPPGGSSTDAIEPIHQKFAFKEGATWERTDIWGLLAAAYALLLSSSLPLISSPRHGSSPLGRLQGSTEIRRAFRHCLDAPKELKSMTFAKLSLLPVLRRPSQNSGTKCDASEFLLAVLSEFVSNYLDVLSASGLPPSRKNWQTEQEEALQLERENQKQKAEFRLWIGQYNQGEKEDPVPSSVDLLNRPDCFDDIVALAVALADLGPEFALKFWGVKKEDAEEDGGGSITILTPSRALLVIQKASAEDDSLLHFYLALLGALAKAEHPDVSDNGATAVNAMLSNKTYSEHWSWVYIFDTIRWYIRQFNDLKSSATTSSSSSTSSSTSYYYRNVNLTSTAHQASQSPSIAKPAELGETNTFYLLSLLNLISNVASKSSVSRLQILSMQLPITVESSNTVVGNDTTLTILFALVTAPLPPEIRGMTFTAISNLLKNDGLSLEASTKLREFVTKAWELVESCQVVPVMLLDQYTQAAGEEMLRNTSGLRFPVSSTSLADTANTRSSWIPLDTRYAILYEMEHVESRVGYYSSTEGFLRLLNSLFSNDSPSHLGQNWRLRSGSTPYIEYVIHFILPRATGSISGLGILPFRSRGDQARLVALALAVIDSVLIRYSFETPGNAPRTVPAFRGVLQVLKQRVLAETVARPQKLEFHHDFDNKPVLLEHQSQSDSLQKNSVHSLRASSSGSTPAPKSPGFVVLADLLSATTGHVLKAISLLLIERVSTISVVGEEASKIADTYALFRDTPPTTSSAKYAGMEERNPSALRATLLKGLRPHAETVSYSGAVFWRERCVSHALHILCAAAVREEAFYTAVNGARTPLKIVPILRFGSRSPYGSQVTTQSIHLMRLKDLLSASRDILGSIVEFIGYSASSDECDIRIASSGLSLVSFVHQSLPSGTAMQILCGDSLWERKRLSQAIAQRLLISFDHTDSIAHVQALSLIFEWILNDLRGHRAPDLSFTLLGMAGDEFQRGLSKAKREAGDCFEAILALLSEPRFVLDWETSAFAANSLEILVRACDLSRVDDEKSLGRVLYAAERLRSIGFWREKFRFMMRTSERSGLTEFQAAVEVGNDGVIHVLAWILKGMASELHLLMGYGPDQLDTRTVVGYLAPRPGDCEQTLSLLFGAEGRLLEKVVLALPVERSSIDDTARFPSQNVIRKAIRSLEGSPDIIDGYLVVDEESLLSALLETDSSHIEDYKRWSSSWNQAVKMDCAASHLSDSIRVLLGIAFVCFSRSRDQRGNSLVSLLAAVLSRLLEAFDSTEVSATTSRNLSWTVLLLSTGLASLASSSRNGVADLRSIRDLLARTLVSSGRQAGGVEAVRHQETTALLSVALLEIMKELPLIEADIDRRLFLEVAIELVQVSKVLDVSSSSQNSHLAARAIVSRAPPSEPAIIARSSLVRLIEIWDEGIASSSESLAYAFLIHPSPADTNESCIESLLALLASLDEDVATLFQKFAQVPFLGDLLLDSGLTKALLAAAEAYMTEERRLRSLSLQLQSSEMVTVGFPSFLGKHLELLSSLMASSTMLSADNRRELPRHVFNILSRYDTVIERLFSSFPSSGDHLCTLLQSVAQLCLIAETACVSSVSDSLLQPVPNGRVPFRGSKMERAILHVSLHIAENPLPSNRLSKVPHSLEKTTNTMSSVLVEVSSGKQKSWWDSSYVLSGRSWISSADFGDWDEAMFEHAVLGADILWAGLTVLAKLPPQGFAIEMSFVRGLFQLAKAALVVDEQVGLVDMAMPQVYPMEITDTNENNALSLQNRMVHMKNLGKKLGKNVLKFLVALLQRVRIFAQEPENRMNRPMSEYCKAIMDALDHAEIGSRGVGCTAGDERQLGKQIVAALRKELASLSM